MCADRNVWQYHPIIGSISVDYKEQVVITGIKSGLQCWICYIPPEERKNFCKVWLRQIYKSMYAQLAWQNTIEWIEENSPKHLNCIYSVTNFAWSHFFMNIHQYIFLDIFYQLLKGVIGSIYMLQYLKNNAEAKFMGARVKTGKTKLLNQANRTVFLDEWFCYMLLYPIVKIFKEYSKVKQWNESKY